MESMRSLIQRKKSEFPEWVRDDSCLDVLCRSPSGHANDLWRCLGGDDGKIVVREHHQLRLKFFVSPERDVSNRPSMTFVWYETGQCEVIYSQKPTSTNLKGRWKGFTIYQWGLSLSNAETALGER